MTPPARDLPPARLAPAEVMRLDPAPLAALRAEHGATAATALLHRTFEELSMLRTMLGSIAAPAEEEAAILARMGDVAGRIGLPDLAAAARAAAATARTGDRAAAAATRARVDRLAVLALDGLTRIRTGGG